MGGYRNLGNRGFCHSGVAVYLWHMKKLLLLILLAGVGYLVYRKVTEVETDDDLWSEVGANQDLR